MTNNPIEEVLRLAVPMGSMTVHLRDHEVTFRSDVGVLVQLADNIEVLSMHLTPGCGSSMMQRVPIW